MLGRVLVDERDRGLPGVGLDQRHVSLGQVLGHRGDHVRVGAHQHRLGTGAVLGLRHQVPRQVLGRRAWRRHRMISSLGPASDSIPTSPNSRRLASSTYALPGPTTTSTAGIASVPSAIAATAWAPPAAYTSVTPRSAQTARMAECTRPSAAGGEQHTDLGTPATWAGHDRHHRTGRIGGTASGDVQAGPLHRDVTGRDDLALGQLHPRGRRQQLGRHRSQIRSQKLDRFPDGRIDLVQGTRQLAGLDPALRKIGTVQPRGQATQRIIAAAPDHVDDVGHGATHIVARLECRSQPHSCGDHPVTG